MRREQASDCAGAELVKRYQADPADRWAAEVVHFYRKWVRLVIREFAQNAGVTNLTEDLETPAMLGLLKAAALYQPDGPHRFKPFAKVVITRAMIDFLRVHGPVNKYRSSQFRKLKSAEADFVGRYGRLPTMAELARDLHMDEDKLVLAYERPEPLSLDLLLVPGQAASLEDFLPSSENIEQLALDRDELRWVFRTVAQWDERRRQIFYLAYVLQLPQAEIGRRFGVSESRICQQLTQMARQLRDMRSRTREPVQAPPPIQLMAMKCKLASRRD